MNDKAIYNDDSAERMKARAGEKYRPTSGAEGAIFMNQFCDQCVKDQKFRETLADSCPIMVATFGLAVDNPDYPTEWRYGSDGQPTCTAFEEVP